MPRKPVDYTGHRQGKLLIKQQAETYPRGAGKPIWWQAECDCGNTHVLNSASIKNGTRSCGCLIKERASEIHREYTTAEEAQQVAVTRATLWNREHPERRKEIRQEFHRRHPEKSSQKEARRRARKKAQVCTCCTPESLEPIYKFARAAGMEVDHIHPLAKGGLHCEYNLQLLPPEVNRAKGARQAG